MKNRAKNFEPKNWRELLEIFRKRGGGRLNIAGILA